MFRNHIYLIYMYDKDLVLNDLQWLICYKLNQVKGNFYIINTGFKIYVCYKFWKNLLRYTNVK